MKRARFLQQRGLLAPHSRKLAIDGAPSKRKNARIIGPCPAGPKAANFGPTFPLKPRPRFSRWHRPWFWPFAFFVAYVDDRVKSSFDIEAVVGLPLIGIIPEIKRMEQPEKAQIVVQQCRPARLPRAFPHAAFQPAAQRTKARTPKSS